MRNLRRLLKLHQRFGISRNFSAGSNNVSPKIAIVGSGPAGFYTAQKILKSHSSAKVDIYEKLPVPFGLVRFGVAPDHPNVKNVINTFTSTAGNDRCTFIGNVSVGRDVSIKQLQNDYTAVVLSYGADDDNVFGIPGENLNGVLSARNFVGWYNGLPENSNLNPNLDTEVAVVLGHGNVAIDVARILLTPVDILKKTDITEYAMDKLFTSRIKHVYLVGRRGPMQVKFTTAELREMFLLEDTRAVLKPEDFKDCEDFLRENKKRRGRRLPELMVKFATNPSDEDKIRWNKAAREWILKFLRSPKEFLSDGGGENVSAVKLAVNRLEVSGETQFAIPTGDVEDIQCGLVLKSIGYKSIPIDSDVPFNSEKGIIPNKHGKVEGDNNLYCSGWVKRGPVGVITSTMTDGFETGINVVKDLNENRLNVSNTHTGKIAILDHLKSKDIQPVLFSDWEKIDMEEIKRGQILGKPREKIVDNNEMLKLVKSISR